MDKQFLRNGHVTPFQSIVAQVEAGDGTINGAAFDRADHAEDYADALVVASFGDLGGGGTLSSVVTIEESDTEGSGYTAVSSDLIIDEASMTFTGVGVQYRSLRLNKCKRFVRAVAASDFTAGTSPSIPLSVLIVGINPRWSPSEDN